MSSFCIAIAIHIFSANKFQYICVSLDVNFKELFTNVFEQLGPGEIVYNIYPKYWDTLLLNLLLLQFEQIHLLKK